MRKTGRKTLKLNNKAGNRFLERKVLMASLFNGAHRDVTNKVLRSYVASRIQKSRRTMVSKKDFENEFELGVSLDFTSLSVLFKYSNHYFCCMFVSIHCCAL